MGNETIRSHFVWRKYLEAFAEANGCVCCYDKENNKYIKTNTANLAVENNSLKLDKKISEDDTSFIKDFFHKKIFQHPQLRDDANFHLTNIKNFLNNDILEVTLDFSKAALDTILSKEKKQAVEDYMQKKWNNLMKESYTEEYKKMNQQEKIFTFYESNFLPIYDNLLNKDLDFYYNSVDPKINQRGLIQSTIIYAIGVLNLRNGAMSLYNAFKAKLKEAIHVKKDISDVFKNDTAKKPIELTSNFLIFILSQHLRTAKHKNKTIENFENFRNSLKDAPPNYYMSLQKLDLKNFYALYTHFFIPYFADELFYQKYHPIILTNETSLNFITADQPIVNTYIHNKKPIELEKGELELYYPLTPRLALLLTKKDALASQREISISKTEDIKFYNDLIKKYADRWIYGTE